MALLVDTSILIDWSRGHLPARTYLAGLVEYPLVSGVTLAEVSSGMRSQREERALERLMRRWRIIPLTTDAARRGGVFRRLYGPSHGVGLMDALIAACAEAEGARLVTRNVKHFPMLTDIEAPY